MELRNRGKEASDNDLFGKEHMLNKIQSAIYDLSFLLERGYSNKSSKILIGNRYKLNQRQIKAVAGMSAGATSVISRSKKELTKENLNGKEVIIDGFNLVIIMESILSEAFVFKGLDGCFRDLSSVHGSYKRVNQTQSALYIMGDFLAELGVKKVTWVFDKPVSNSGRLKTILSEIAREKNYSWNVLLDYNPDKFLVESQEICISSDAWILENCASWFNLIKALFEHNLIESNTIIEGDLQLI